MADPPGLALELPPVPKNRLIVLLILLGCAPKVVQPLRAPQTLLARWEHRRGVLTQRLEGSGRLHYEGLTTWEGRFLFTATPQSVRFQLLGPLGFPMGEIRVEGEEIRLSTRGEDRVLSAHKMGPLMLALGLFFGNLSPKLKVLDGYETRDHFALLLAGYGDTVEVRFRKTPLEPQTLQSLSLKAGHVSLSDYRRVGTFYLPWTLFYRGQRETLELRFETLRLQNEEVKG